VRARFISYKFSNRDLAEIILERDLAMVLNTIYRWG
jgi:transposase-like protein